jgi:GntR family transcriptional regulator
VTSAARRRQPPRYVAIAAELRDRIVDQQLPAHTLLPSERELGERFGVSRMTARQALTLLESEGHVYRRPPRGTFVAEGRVRFHIGSFSEAVARMGRRASAELLWAKRLDDAPTAQRAMQVPPGSPVHGFQRLRAIEGEPFAIETTYFPAELTPGILDLDIDGSLWLLVRQQYGVHFERSVAILESVILDESSSSLLRVRAASNGILLTRTTYDGAGRCVEFARDVYRADRAAFEVSVPLADDS